MKRWLLLFTLAALALGAFAQTKSPAETLKSIREFENKKIDEGIKADKLDFEAIQADVKRMAADAVKGIDPEKVEPKEGQAWAELFMMAGNPKACCAAATRFLSSNPSPNEKFAAQNLMMQACAEQGEGEMVLMTLVNTKPTSPADATNLASMVTYVYLDPILKTEGPEAALKAIDYTLSVFASEDPAVMVQRVLPGEIKRRKDAGATVDEEAVKKELEARYRDVPFRNKVGLISKKAEILADMGKTAEGLALLEDFKKSLPEGSTVTRSVDAAKALMTLKGNTAPALEVERAHMSFPGLAAWKGKVVILDFFAHWCGPCIASFPDMKQLYADLHGQGLEIVGVTTYYGYYKKDRGITPDVEFGKMGEFIGEHQLPWPVAYGPRSNFEKYGVTGIPHVVVIGRDGKVHKYKVGYDAKGFAAFREEIQKLIDSN